MITYIWGESRARHSAWTGIISVCGVEQGGSSALFFFFAVLFSDLLIMIVSFSSYKSGALAGKKETGIKVVMASTTVRRVIRGSTVTWCPVTLPSHSASLFSEKIYSF